jgi:hypothetical protein
MQQTEAEILKCLNTTYSSNAVDHNVSDDEYDDDNNSIQFFIIYVLSQQPQGQLQTQHSVGKSSYILDKQNVKSKTN